jgi:hypothetical protein
MESRETATENDDTSPPSFPAPAARSAIALRA